MAGCTKNPIESSLVELLHNEIATAKGSIGKHNSSLVELENNLLSNRVSLPKLALKYDITNIGIDKANRDLTNLLKETIFSTAETFDDFPIVIFKYDKVVSHEYREMFGTIRIQANKTEYDSFFQSGENDKSSCLNKNFSGIIEPSLIVYKTSSGWSFCAYYYLEIHE
jgi:hypothetical protein